MSFIKPYKIYLFITLSIFLSNSCKKNSIIFEDNFNTNSNHWDTISSKQITTEIENGYLKMSGRLNDVINIALIPLSISNQNTSLITSSLQVNNFYGNEGIAGLILFADDQKFPENYLFFGINSRDEVVITFESKNKNFAKTFYKQKNKFYKAWKMNDFSILTDKNTIHFLLNNKVVFTIQKSNKPGNFFGYVVLNSQMYVDNFQLKKR